MKTANENKKIYYFLGGALMIMIIVGLISILLNEDLQQNIRTTPTIVAERPAEPIFEGLGTGTVDTNAVGEIDFLPPTIEEKIFNIYDLSSFLSDAVLIRLQDAILTVLSNVNINTADVVMDRDFDIDLQTRVLAFLLYNSQNEFIGTVNLYIENGANIHNVRLTFPNGHSLQVPY
ncbi:MAG: hypothetical protein LBG64_01895 [Pseudomonadales bacterium]|jgi:hypothetical protein|nr:hypothetical protein [Pseudomonadales bacterium]